MKKHLSPTSLMIAALFVVSLGCSTFLLAENQHLQSTSLSIDNQLTDDNPSILPDIEMIDLIVEKLVDSATRRLSNN
jgi:hypothetical protein